jgi:hypothetical protein
MTALYQEQLNELYKKKLADQSLPTVYKWTSNDHRYGQQKQKQKAYTILIETQTTTFSRCLNGCSNCEGSFEINGRIMSAGVATKGVTSQRRQHKRG